jgi:GR25 family glycosyltransferase involved in LPS biosynthesis
MMLGILLSLVMTIQCVAAPLESYFKKATGKGNNHAMKNIDFIYTINLDQRPEKFAKCTEQLHKFNIYPYRFSAINGWELSLEVINDVGVKYEAWMTKNLWGTAYLPDENFKHRHEVMNVVGRNYFCHCTARGTIGIVLSHLSVLQDAYNSGYNTIWVMEDDIEIIRNPHEISTMIEKLDNIVGPNGWDILFTDRDIKNACGKYVPCASYASRPNYEPHNPRRFAFKKRISNQLRKIGARYGTHSMIIRRSGIEKLLKFFLQYGLFLPYDMDMFMPNGMRFFTVLDDIVSNLPQALSDNGVPNYLSNTNHEKKQLKKLT